MKLKVPKKERRKSGDSRGKHILRNVMIVLCVLALMGLAGTHLLKLITGNEMLAIPENGVAAVITPLQSGFASVVNWISDYFYTLKLRSRLELEYNNLRQENEQLTYQAMLAEELRHKLSVYENLFDEVSDNEQLNPLVATVIGRESGNYFSVFTINKGAPGRRSGYMAVTMNGALVGYTYNTKTTSASVRTIIDSEASIAGLISTSRDQGTVRGTLGIDGQPMCRMYYLPEENLPRPRRSGGHLRRRHVLPQGHPHRHRAGKRPRHGEQQAVHRGGAFPPISSASSTSSSCATSRRPKPWRIVPPAPTP